MKSRIAWSRRRMLAVSGVALLGRAASAAAPRQRTPAQTSGPFYPLEKPLDQDADLTLIKGRGQRAAGQIVHVMGRVLDAAGEPVEGARLEIWQANTYGRYTHPGDRNPAALDPGFEGFATLVSDAEGRYRFKTIKPGGYPAGRDVTRTPHIHFDVRTKGSRLVTQMYFPSEQLEGDGIFLSTSKESRSLLIADVTAPTRDLEPDSLLARWDIILETG
jgi:protocatechuate 3,4-dioxygenase beta subunit